MPAMQKSPGRVEPIRLPVLLAFIAAGLAGAIAEVLFLPYLVTTPLYLSLTLATTIVVAASVGLTRSGVRRGLPRPLRLGSTAIVAALSLTTFFVLVVLPYLGGSGVRHDRAVSFATPAAPSAAAANAAPASAPATSTAPSTSAPAPAPAPVVTTGTFNHGPGPDTVSGSVMLGKTQDGASVLRVSGLDATPGPDLYLYLVRVESPNSTQVTTGVLVTALKTYRGDFTFTLDPGLDLAQFKAVAVHCRSFNVVFGYANLK